VAWCRSTDLVPLGWQRDVYHHLCCELMHGNRLRRVAIVDVHGRIKLHDLTPSGVKPVSPQGRTQPTRGGAACSRGGVRTLCVLTRRRCLLASAVVRFFLWIVICCFSSSQACIKRFLSPKCLGQKSTREREKKDTQFAPSGCVAQFAGGLTLRHDFTRRITRNTDGMRSCFTRRSWHEPVTS